MPKLKVNGLELEHDTFGRAQGRPLLMIMGLGAQMVQWDDELCEQLAARGQYVIRFDNRDVGLSTQCDHLGAPDFHALSGPNPPPPPYTLDDMADDTVGVLDALGLASAHVCGASMGGMIAQTVAYRHPARLRSLISIMSTTGNPALPSSKPEALTALLTPPPVERAAAIEHGVWVMRTIGSPRYFDEARARQRVTMQFDRAVTPRGTARHIAAVITHGNRAPRLAAVRVPTLVIHGVQDPLVPIEGGRDTARSIPGAELLELEDMGHDLPRPLWPQLVDAISAHTARAEAAR